MAFAAKARDTVVVTLVLRAAPDDRQAIRVLRSRGRVVWLQHVRSTVDPVCLTQRLLDPLLVRLEADDLPRDLIDHLEPEKFTIERLMRSRLGYLERSVARWIAAI